MGGSAAIASMVKNIGPSLESFVRHHLEIGFQRIYLFFDDPKDPDIERVRGIPEVKVIRHDRKLRDRWQTLTDYRSLLEWVDAAGGQTGQMARQVLNVKLAIKMAARDGIDWLLHIDGDELFFPGPDCRAVEDHFAELDAAGLKSIVYLNHEAILDRWEVEDGFKELTYFRINPNHELWTAATAKAKRARAAVLRRSSAARRAIKYHYYGEGKGAGRVSSALEVLGVHKFASTELPLVERQRQIAAHGKLYAARGLPELVDFNYVTDGPCILHYPDRGLSAFLRKIGARGPFSNILVDLAYLPWGGDVRHFADKLLPEALAAIEAGKGKQFFEKQCLVSDRKLLERLVRSGLVTRIQDVSRRLLSPS